MRRPAPPRHDFATTRVRVIAVAVALVAIAGVAAGLASRRAAASGDRPASAGLSAILSAGGLLTAPTVTRLADPAGAVPRLPSTAYSVTVGSTTRYLRLRAVAGSQPQPLLLVLPGWRRSARDSETDFGLDSLAGVDIAYLDGEHSSWDAGSCCGYAAANHVDDVAWLHTAVDAVASLTPVDRTRVVLAGFSNGGMLALRAGCEQSGQLAGVISVSGSLQVPSCQPATPLTVVLGHGARDRTVPLAGAASSAYLGGPVTSQAASVAPFLAADRCASSSVTKRRSFSVTRVRGCAGGVTIDEYVDDAVGHAWLPAVPGGATFGEAAWALTQTHHSVEPFSA